MQRAKNDESTKAQPEDFNFDIFEELVQARTLFIEGKATEAKKSLELSQIEIERDYSDYPVAMAPDSLKVMLDLGDFEEATKVGQVIKDNPSKVDNSILHLVDSELNKNADEQKHYIKHNKKGIKLYSAAKFSEAYEEFSKAKEISPLNIGVSLNLLQSVTKLIQNSQKPEMEHVNEARKNYQFIKNMPLKDVHKTKFTKMLADVEKVIK